MICSLPLRQSPSAIPSSPTTKGSSPGSTACLARIGLSHSNMMVLPPPPKVSDDAAVVLGDFRIEELAAQRFEAFECPFLIRPHEPRIPRHIGGEDRGETAAGGHCSGT